MSTESLDPTPSDTSPPAVSVVLHHQLLEQLMRCCEDETVLYDVQRVSSRAELAAAVGRALPALSLSPVAGSPVAAILGLADLDEQWRAACPVQDASLFAELELLRVLGCAEHGLDPLAELCAAREVARSHSAQRPSRPPTAQ